LLFGSSFNGENDSTLRSVNFNGDIKKVYPLIYPSIISSKNPVKVLCPDGNEMYPYTIARAGDKIFISFRYSYYGYKGYKTKYPIVGCYDMGKDTLIMNTDIWYPGLRDGVYQKWYMHETYLSINKKGNVIISFTYTPTFYEWNYKTNQLDTHTVNSQFMEPIPYSKKIYKNDEEYNDCEYYFGAYLRIKSNCLSDSPYIYYRDILLPSLKYEKFNYLRVFFDENYQYMGESIVDKKERSMQTYKNKQVSATIENGRIIVRFAKTTFKPFNKEKLKEKLSLMAKAKVEKEAKEKKELCNIIGGNPNTFSYQTNDILKYLEKSHNIKDSSFSIAIINKNGCGSCNDYVLDFIMLNQGVLYNIKDRPFYVLYVDENNTNLGIYDYLGTYKIFDKYHTKCDVSTVYKKFHPFAIYNPRLVLVSHNNVICDEVYMPDEIDQLATKILDYYGLEKE
jgi:hypothetical protein